MVIIREQKYAVIGAGCGGQGIAGHLASKGFDVRLYNRSTERISHIKETGQIRLDGVLRSTGRLSYIGTDISRALKDRDIIFVVTTATGHRDVAESMSPYLRDGQIILLNPGRTGGVLEVDHVLKQSGCQADVIVAEANTLVYAVRLTAPGVATIKGVKKEVSVAALNSRDTEQVLTRTHSAYPQFVAASSFLETSFGNIGAIFHPVLTLFNKDRISAGEEFDFYVDGLTREAAASIEVVDYEVCRVANALGTSVLPVTKWLVSRYGVELSDIYTMIRSTPTYQGIKAPPTLDVRYLWEDIPTGLVPISVFGKALGISTPKIDSLIDEACAVLGRNFWEEGRTPEKLGLSMEYLREDLEQRINLRKLGA